MLHTFVRHTIAAASMLAATAAAHAAPPANWPVGTTLSAIAQSPDQQSTCEIGNFPSAAITGANTFFTFSELDYFPPNYLQTGTEFTFYGAAHLAFQTSTGGTLHFDAYGATVPIGQPLPPAPPITFSNYKATTTLNPPTLTVSYTVMLGTCPLPVRSTYHHA